MLAAAPETRRMDAEYSLGVALYKAARYPEAIKELTVVTTDGASSYAKPARLQLGLVQLAAGKVADARNTLSAVAKEDPPRAPEAQYGLAECDIVEKKFEPARASLDQLAHLQPPPANLPQILLDRAVCVMELGKFEEAAKEFADFQRDNPKSPQIAEAMYREAFCLHRLGKYEQSHAICDALAKLPSSDLSGKAAELDAENLFLLAKYPDAEKAFAALASRRERSGPRTAVADAHRAVRIFRGQLRQGRRAVAAAGSGAEGLGNRRVAGGNVSAGRRAAPAGEERRGRRRA